MPYFTRQTVLYASLGVRLPSIPTTPYLRKLEGA